MYIHGIVEVRSRQFNLLNGSGTTVPKYLHQGDESSGVRKKL